MKTISIQVPDDFKVPEGYKVQIVKKEEKPIIRTIQIINMLFVELVIG